MTMSDLSFAAGEVVGAWLAPLAAGGSIARHARLFHPDGVCFRGSVSAADGPLQAAGERLGPTVLLRLSSAWWRNGKEWPDALGIALRFQPEPGAPPTAEDQDLLLATIPLPILPPLAPLFTHVHDFLANTYYAVSPLKLEGVGTVRLRLRARQPSPPGPSRVARLEASIMLGQAVLVLEAQASLLSPYQPLAEVRVARRLDLDQEALRFSPFRTGRGIEPRGFVHGLRRAVYPVSQAVRPAQDPGYLD